jgi:hypothetical protein
MTTESLIVELDAKTGKLESALKSATDRLDELEGSTEQADIGLGNLTKTAGLVGGAIKVMAGAIVTAGTALSTMIVLTAKNEQELQSMSRQAKLTTGDFEALAFATKQYGINAEQIADISKDVSDKLGEYAATGSGAFQDFADVTGKSTEEAQRLASEWQSLSSQEVILEVSRQLEEAGASADETTFVLESLGNDLSKLTPLFAENGKELEKLTTRYKDINDQIGLTAEEAAQLQEAATSFDLLTESIGNGTKLIAAQFAPALNEFFNGVIDVVPRATQVVVDFINTFRNAENIENIDSLNRLIAEQEEAIAGLTEKRDAYVGQSNGYITAQQDEIANKAQLNTEIQTESMRLDELIAKRDQLLEQQQIMADAQTQDGGSIGATLGIIPVSESGEESPEVVANRENLDYMLVDYQEYAAARLAAEQDLAKQQADIARYSAKATRDAERSKENAMNAGLSAARGINSALLEDNKAVGAGIIIADTAIGMQKALAQGGIYGWPFAAAIAASGIAQLASLQSASRGGGSVSQASTPPVAPTVAEQPQTIDISNSDLSGQNQAFTIRIEGGGDEVTEAIAKNMKVMQIGGELEA